MALKPQNECQGHFKNSLRFVTKMNPKTIYHSAVPYFLINLIPQKSLNLKRSWYFRNRNLCTYKRTGKDPVRYAKQS
ncbi:hypothetical protein VIGAN_03266700 [Vigna angularis var. angularis]|uniref:Uncharacterized protein n=1 Tax=Vigna angularis var. angularis TaxID=157739 RepID=A0A0S3RPT8_PHAAN|nr:hypothetical protein VIGAN_03266700 [Vigna angularis var. angularis]